MNTGEISFVHSWLKKTLPPSSWPVPRQAMASLLVLMFLQVYQGIDLGKERLEQNSSVHSWL